MGAPKAFVSYSHKDADFVVDIARKLRELGVDAWLDSWEIEPGQSIVQRIFEVGLKEAKFFFVVLSRDSVRSPWVREELDAATLRRIEGVARVIPILKEDCDIPMALRALRWVDFRKGLDPGIEELVKVAHGVWDKPAVGEAPSYVRELAESVAGLSRPASTVGSVLLELESSDEGFEQYHESGLLKARCALPDDDLNDAVEELEEHGLVSVLRTLGTAPFRFHAVAPTYALYLHFAEYLGYKPQEDIRIVAAAVVALRTARGPALQDHTGLSVGRLNRAVQYLQDSGLVQGSGELGTAPYAFGSVQATRHTREYVERRA